MLDLVRLLLRGGYCIMLEFKLGLGSLYWTFLMTDNSKISDCEVLLDTGASFTYITASGLINDVRLRKAVAARLVGNTNQSSAKIADGRELRAYPLVLQNVNLGGIQLRSMRVYVDFDSNNDIMLLGCDFIRYCNLVKSVNRKSISITAVDLKAYYKSIQNDSSIMGSLNKLLAVNECVGIRNGKYIIKGDTGGIMTYNKEQIKHLLHRGEYIEGLRLSTDGKLLVARTLR